MECIRQQAQSEADRRSNAMLMGYMGSSTYSEPNIQSGVTYAGQYEDADVTTVTQLQGEACKAYPQDYADMPQLVTSDDKDDWDPHADFEEEDHIAS